MTSSYPDFCACGTLVEPIAFRQWITYRAHLGGSMNDLTKKLAFTKKSELSIRLCSLNVVLDILYISCKKLVHPRYFGLVTLPSL